MKTACFFLLIYLLTGCNSRPNKLPPAVIYLQPLGKTDSLLVNRVFRFLKENNGNPCLKVSPVLLPQAAYLEIQKRYCADSILSFLSQMESKHINKWIGITEADMETSRNGQQHWGVMGLSYCPGNGAVVSTFRLKRGGIQEEILFSRVLTVCLHEIGHSFSLPHCKDPSCIMKDAKGGMPAAIVGRFCGNCLIMLRSKGWEYHPPPTTYSQQAENK